VNTVWLDHEAATAVAKVNPLVEQVKVEAEYDFKSFLKI
jgi:hypothetical protein